MPRKYPFNLSAGDKCEITFEVVADKMAEFKFMKGKREIKPNNKVSDIHVCTYVCMYVYMYVHYFIETQNVLMCWGNLGCPLILMRSYNHFFHIILVVIR